MLYLSGSTRCFRGHLQTIVLKDQEQNCVNYILQYGALCAKFVSNSFSVCMEKAGMACLSAAH